MSETLCKQCSKPFSPTHDIHAPGPNVRHPFIPAPPVAPKPAPTPAETLARSKAIALVGQLSEAVHTPYKQGHRPCLADCLGGLRHALEAGEDNEAIRNVLGIFAEARP